MRHARCLGIGVGFGDALGVDVDPEAASAVLFRGGDGDSAVAAPQVEDHIALGDVGQGQHPVNHVLRGGDIGGKLRGIGAFGGRGGMEASDRGLEVDLETGLEIERLLFASLFATKDRAIGMTSFVEHGPGKAQFEGR